MIVSHHQSERDKQFDQLNSMIFDLEQSFKDEKNVKRTLFDARALVNRAKYLNRVNEENILRDKRDAENKASGE